MAGTSYGTGLLEHNPPSLCGSSAPTRGGRRKGYRRVARRRASSAAVPGTEITHSETQRASLPSPSPRVRKCLRLPASPCSTRLVGTDDCGLPLHPLPLQLFPPGFLPECPYLAHSLRLGADPSPAAGRCRGAWQPRSPPSSDDRGGVGAGTLRPPFLLARSLRL